MTFAAKTIGRVKRANRPPTFWRPPPKVELSEHQARALLAYIDNAIPESVTRNMQEKLRDLGLLRPTGPRHRSHHLTPTGERVVMAIVYRQHLQYARPMHAVLQLKAQLRVKPSKEPQSTRPVYQERQQTEAA